MKDNDEFLESIYKKKEMYLMNEEKKRKKLARRLIISASGVLCAALICVFIIPLFRNSGKTGTVVYARDLMDGFVARKIASADGRQADDIFRKGYADFAFGLFSKTAASNDNTMISPLSVYIALAMTANGADGETLEEMEKVLGISISELNPYMLAYAASLTGDDGGSINIANSVWFRDNKNLNVKESFLQNNADYYMSDAFCAPFNEETVKDINKWVSESTDGMVDSVINKINEEDMLYLINAVLFEAEWSAMYEEYSVSDGIFTNASGEEKNASLMSSTEHVYLYDDEVTGIIKNYKNSQYSFVALLPNEGISASEYAASLTGEKWFKLLDNRHHEYTVYTKLPKFEYSYSAELKDILGAMGMEKAFGPSADFGKMADGIDLYIGNVLHKTHILVNERGTKAGAVTVIGMCGNSMVLPEYIREVNLDRPFVYAIIDNNTELPIFLGTVMDIE